ncbi:MAG: TIGR03618 family F420-dependent PPOX class oxidoreductase [Pseudomonadales bacterium]|nr:TIGR03618 family F420-dependent PPOX class oxidoreductase [Pseudomonadales bacterium]
MISDNPAWDEFVTAHRWAVLTTLRASGTPSSSVIAYARDGDELVISTPGDRFKVRCIERNPAVNLCIISNAEPFNFVAVEGVATIQRENLVPPTQAVFDAIAGTGYKTPDDLAGWIAREGRVILRIRPERVTAVIR